LKQPGEERSRNVRPQSAQDNTRTRTEIEPFPSFAKRRERTLNPHMEPPTKAVVVGRARKVGAKRKERFGGGTRGKHQHRERDHRSMERKGHIRNWGGKDRGGCVRIGLPKTQAKGLTLFKMERGEFRTRGKPKGKIKWWEDVEKKRRKKKTSCFTNRKKCQERLNKYNRRKVTSKKEGLSVKGDLPARIKKKNLKGKGRRTEWGKQNSTQGREGKIKKLPRKRTGGVRESQFPERPQKESRRRGGIERHHVMSKKWRKLCRRVPKRSALQALNSRGCTRK